MKKFREMLKEQFVLATEFEKQTGVSPISDSFKELMDDILHSDTVCAFLLSQVSAMGIMTPEIVKMLNAYTGEPATAQRIIKKNFKAFHVPLAMLYFGIEIGRKLGAAEAKVADTLKLPTVEPQLSDTEKKWESDLDAAFEKFKKMQVGEKQIHNIEGDQK